jgi:LysM repeat protein
MLGIACAAGCTRPSTDRREARDRHMRRALAAKEAQDIEGAIRWCEQALARKPDLALAHRELGLMLDNYRQDLVGAIYHYRRYLELRPDSRNRADVEDLIRHCRTSFAAQISESPDELKRGLKTRDARIQQLELELAALRYPAEGEPVGSKAKAKEKPVAKKVAAPPAAAPAADQVHVVQAGENLATISMRYYGTRAKWKQIFDANRDRLADANNLRVGTQLTIPPE